MLRNKIGKVLIVSLALIGIGSNQSTVYKLPQHDFTEGHYEHVVVKPESTKEIMVTPTQYKTQHQDAEYKTIFVKNK